MSEEPPSVRPLRQPIRGCGLIVAVHQARVATVRLANGYQTRAHWPPGNPDGAPVLLPGMTVELEFNPYDMRQCRILRPGD